jgi:hypothetical protein
MLFLEKAIDQLVKKLPAFYATRKFTKPGNFFPETKFQGIKAQ